MKKTGEFRSDDAGALAAARAMLSTDTALAPDGAKLMVVLTRTYHSVAAFLASALVEKDVSWDEFVVLEALLHKGPLETTVLASKVRLPSTGVPRVIASLTRRGLTVTRQDRGKNKVHELSGGGLRLATALYDKHRRDIAAAMSGLSSSDTEGLLQGLKRLGRRAETLRQGATDSRRGLAAWQVRKVTEYLRAHLADRVRVADLATQCGLSASAFSRAFKVSMATTPHRWQLAERILTAQTLLREGTTSQAQVAIATGFAEQSHFARVFKDVVGVTPGAWQRRNRP